MLDAIVDLASCHDFLIILMMDATLRILSRFGRETRIASHYLNGSSTACRILSHTVSFDNLIRLGRTFARMIEESFHVLSLMRGTLGTEV